MGWWTVLDLQIQSAFVGALATIGVAMAGFGALYYQIGRQGRDAIEQSRQNEAMRLKLQFYDQMLQTVKAANDATIEHINFLHLYLYQIRLCAASEAGGYNWTPPTSRFSKYRELIIETKNRIIELSMLMENCRIVDRRISIFNTAMSYGIDAINSANAGFPDILMISMPQDVETPPDNWRIPVGERLDAIEKRVEREIYAVSLTSAWVGDFQVEMQNLLLGDLFPTRIPRRDPPDPEQFTIRLDRNVEIEKWFRSSEWGRKGEANEAAAWARFGTTPEAIP
jgi:hypothetical protein